MDGTLINRKVNRFREIFTGPKKPTEDYAINIIKTFCCYLDFKEYYYLHKEPENIRITHSHIIDEVPGKLPPWLWSICVLVNTLRLAEIISAEGMMDNSSIVFRTAMVVGTENDIKITKYILRYCFVTYNLMVTYVKKDYYNLKRRQQRKLTFVEVGEVVDVKVAVKKVRKRVLDLFTAGLKNLATSLGNNSYYTEEKLEAIKKYKLLSLNIND